MLTNLSIRNLAIASELDLEFDSGMTALSGETGAGKSIILDALGLALGDRSSADIVRHGSTRAEVTAVFDLRRLGNALHWLQERELEQDSECIIRRTVTREGRSRSYINGQVVPLQDLREFSAMLMDIHSQHEHQALLRRENQQQWVDDFGRYPTLLKKVKEAFIKWQTMAQRLEQLQSQSSETEARIQLLEYQVDELDKLNLQARELEELEAEQYKLANAEAILATLQQTSQGMLESDGGCIEQVRQCIHQLDGLQISLAPIDNARSLLEEAAIQLEESNTELRLASDKIELDPERLQEVEGRLGTIYDLARKHRINPDQLPHRHRELAAELASLTATDNNVEALTALTNEQFAVYSEAAGALTASRKKACSELEKAIQKQLTALGMHPTLVVESKPLQQPSATGLEELEMLISMNPGQPPKALRKIASGGELSRISLAIQVITAASSQTPTLVFDEVDVGIGGPTAQIVGRLLRELGGKTQILCVTHLPQVASQGNQHFFVSKLVQNGSTQSKIHLLQDQDRVHEIARMLGGVDITEHSLAHAHEMLASSQLQ